MKHSLVSAAIMAAIGINTMAVAQEQANEQSNDIETVTIKGARYQGYLYSEAEDLSRLNLAIKDIPQSVSVIGEEQMDDFALTNINEVLNTVTGINVEEVETDRTYFTARGFDITNFQVDGLGLPVISGNVHGDVDIAMYEKIEVLRGANGMMTGSGSPAATVNYVRKKPTEEFQANISAQAGKWDAYRVDADVSAPISDNVGARVVIAKEKSQSYLDRYEIDKTVIYGVVNTKLGENTNLLVGASQQTSDAKGNMWGALTLYYADGTPTNFDSSTNTSADWSNWDVTDTRVFAFLDHQFNNNWSIKADYTHIETDEDSELFYTYVARDSETGTTLLDPDTGLGLVGYGSEYDLDDKHDYADIYINGQFDAFGQTHDITMGASYARVAYTDISLYDYHTGNGFPALPAMEEWDGDTPLPEFTDYPTGSDVTEKQIAYYLAGNFSLTDNLNLLSGVRFNKVEVDGESYGEDETLDDSQAVPYVGLVYAITPSVNAYASYTEVFLPQTQRDSDFNRLDPVTGESKEVGVKASLFGDSALVTFAYFDITQTNLAVADGFAENPVSGVQEQVYRPADGINSEGIELDIAGELLPGLQTNLGMTFFDLSGDDLVEGYTPEKMVTLNATYQIPALPALRVGATLRWQEDTSRYVGNVPAAYDNAGEAITIEQDAYTLIGLMASYAITPQFSVTANINNLTNERYLKSLYWEQGYYGAPRSYNVTATYRF